MNTIEKSAFVQAIIDGFNKMKELGYCNETEIYTIGVSGRSITSPNGAFVFKTRYVTISRIIEGETNAIKIYCCDAEKDFTIEVNTRQQVEDAVTWMLEKDIMPDIESMRTLVIPAQFIYF